MNNTAPLSEREREVCDLICLGRSDKEISAKLDIKIVTVRFHKSSIFKKLEVKSKYALIVKLHARDMY